MGDWVDVTEHFSEQRRHYRNTYLEIDEVYDDVVEVSLFSSKNDPYEIYFSYDIFYGIIYVDADKAHAKREEIKIELKKEYDINKKATSEFINSFAKKHEVCLPFDVLFDEEAFIKRFTS